MALLAARVAVDRRGEQRMAEPEATLLDLDQARVDGPRELLPGGFG